MILNLKFSNYRSFKNDCIFTTQPGKSKAKLMNLCDIETQGEGTKQALKVSVFFGANASGKTNVIKFLYGLKRWVQNLDNRMGENIPLYDPFKFDDQTMEAPIEFFIEFIANELRYNYYLKFNRKEVLSENLTYFPNGKATGLFKRLHPKTVSTHTVQFGPKVTGIKPFIVFPNQLLLSKFIIDTPAAKITEAAKYLSDLVVSNGYHEDIKLGIYDNMMEWIAKHPKDKQKLAELLAFADTGIKDFQLEKRHSDKSYEVKSQHRRFNNGEFVGKTDLPFTEESFGTRALFLLGCYILQSLDSGSPLLVDEIDSGLHSYITQLIVEIFKNSRINPNNAQLIFTTHDVNLLDQNSIRRDQIWFVEKNEYGISELFSLSDFEDVREDTPFGKWYMNNKFGAVPTLKSLEKLFATNDTSK
jgi:AAA15 family ATPase/GTPase